MVNSTVQNMHLRPGVKILESFSAKKIKNHMAQNLTLASCESFQMPQNFVRLCYAVLRPVSPNMVIDHPGL
jgi:hypothetical protein